MTLQREFKETTDSLELIYYWYESYHMIGCIFFLVWDLFSLTLFSHVFVSLFKGGYPFPENIFALLTFITLVPAPTYWMLLYVTNKTKVCLSKSEITIKNGPLPCARKSYSIMLRNISHISVKKHCRNSLFDEIWHLKEDEPCSIKAIMKNGDSRYILHDMQNPEDARIVSARIKLWMIEMDSLEPDEGQVRIHSVQRYKKNKLSVRRRDNET